LLDQISHGIFLPACRSVSSTRQGQKKKGRYHEPVDQSFREDLQLAGYAKRSTESYVSSVLRLQRFYNKQLENITEEELRQYWLCCQTEFGWSAA
jgi:hypothetical protein